MKKNRTLSIALVSIFMLSVLTIPVRAKASLFSKSKAFKVGLLIAGSLAGLKLLRSIFFSDRRDKEGEINGINVKIVLGDITRQKNVDVIVRPYSRFSRYHRNRKKTIYIEPTAFDNNTLNEKKLKKMYSRLFKKVNKKGADSIAIQSFNKRFYRLSVKNKQRLADIALDAVRKYSKKKKGDLKEIRFVLKKIASKRNFNKALRRELRRIPTKNKNLKKIN